MTSICLALVASLAAYFSIHSLLIASTETSTLPLADIWLFYVDYFKYVDGNYSFWHLFDRHNDHVIVTTRLALFVDTIWFGASGKFVLAVTYLTALVSALMVAYLAAKPKKWEVAGLTIAFLGLTWAFLQLDNLTLPFQLEFPLVHAFALATLIALWLGLAGGRLWYVLVFACDFGAVFSVGSGVMVGVSAIAIAVWARKWDRVFALFLIFHITLIVLYAWLVIGHGYSPRLPPTLTEAIAYFATFLGNFAYWPDWALPVGLIVVALCAGLFCWLTWGSFRRGAPPAGEVVILAAFALFMILEAAAATLGRAKFGVSQARELRYTTCTLLLVATLFALAWRLFPKRVSRISTLLALTAVLFVANNSFVENGWRKRNQEMDVMAAEIAKGTLPPGAAATLYVPANIFFEPLIWRFRASELGPFRPHPTTSNP